MRARLLRCKKTKKKAEEKKKCIRGVGKRPRRQRSHGDRVPATARAEQRWENVWDGARLGGRATISSVRGTGGNAYFPRLGSSPNSQPALTSRPPSPLFAYNLPPPPARFETAAVVLFIQQYSLPTTTYTADTLLSLSLSLSYRISSGCCCCCCYCNVYAYKALDVFTNYFYIHKIKINSLYWEASTIRLVCCFYFIFSRNPSIILVVRHSVTDRMKKKKKNCLKMKSPV